MSHLSLRTRTIASTGAFPTAPRSTWTPTQLAQWQTARSVVDGLTENAPGGWAHEDAGHYPGTLRGIGCWAVGLVAAVAVVHYGTGHLGQTSAAYLAAAVGAALILLGVLVHGHVWGGYTASGTAPAHSHPTTTTTGAAARPAHRTGEAA